MSAAAAALSPPTHSEPATLRQQQPGAHRIPSLDGLRAISIGLVLFAHALDTDGFRSTHFMERFAGAGILGVQIFFVISGYLITLLLVQEKNRTGGISLKRFYIRRAFRILPVFYAFLAVVIALRLAGAVVVPGRDLAAALLYTMNFLPHPSWWIGHVWSLSVEEQFYLVWPLAMKMCSQASCVRLAVAAVAVTPALRCLIFYFDPKAEGWAPILAPQFGDVLAMGCLLALLLPQWKQNRAFMRAIRSPLPLLVLPPAMLVLNALRLRPDLCPMWLALPVGQVIIAGCAALIIARITTVQDGWVTRALNWRPVAMVGVLSYSIYIWQQLFLNREAHSIWNFFPFNVGCALAVAALSYFLLEKPLLSLRRRYA